LPILERRELPAESISTAIKNSTLKLFRISV